jgi:hypothetical protein
VQQGVNAIEGRKHLVGGIFMAGSFSGLHAFYYDDTNELLEDLVSNKVFFCPSTSNADFCACGFM